jgi:hypothetical protein
MSPRWNPNPDVRTGRHAVNNLHVHVVFVTKYQRNAITDEILTRCEKIMREVCTDFEAELKQFNGETDHVHLLVHYPPKVQLSKLVNSLKRGYPPDSCARNTTATSAAICGADTSGPAPTSQAPAAAHP